MLGLVGLAHVAFAVRDQRVPWDQGLFYPSLRQAWLGLREGVAGELIRLLAEPAGWYEVVLAMWLTAFGRSVAALQGILVLQVLGVVVLAGWLARRSHGPAGGAVAAALTGAAPLVFAMGRGPWLHVTEALTALLALALVERRHAAPMAMAMTLLLRPSALVWAAPVALAWAWRHRGQRRAVLGWSVLLLLAAVPVLLRLEDYLRIKAQARPRYAATLDPPHVEALEMLGLGWMVVVGLGLLLRRRRPSLVETVCITWAVAAVALAYGSASGLFNHTLLAPALAVLAAGGLARWAATAALAAVVLVGQLGASELPFAIPGMAAWSAPASPWTWWRPWRGYGEAEALALLEATCPPRGACVVAADQGLFTPFSEEAGHFELFVTGQDDVQLVPLPAWTRGRPPMPDALAWWACEGAPRASGWQQRHQFTREGLAALLAQLEPAWVVPSAPGCSLVWYVPRGRALRAERLPAGFTPDSKEGKEAMAGLPSLLDPSR